MTKTSEEISNEIVLLINEIEIILKDKDDNTIINTIMNLLIMKTLQFGINPIMVVQQLIVGLKFNHDALVQMDELKKN